MKDPRNFRAGVRVLHEANVKADDLLTSATRGTIVDRGKVLEALSVLRKGRSDAHDAILPEEHGP